MGGGRCSEMSRSQENWDLQCIWTWRHFLRTRSGLQAKRESTAGMGTKDTRKKPTRLP